MVGFTARVGSARVKRVGGSRTVLDALKKLVGRKTTPATARAILKKYNSFTKAVQVATPNILLDALQPTFELSQVYVPKDTLALMKSGYLEVKRSRFSPTVHIGYGLNNNPYYAGFVHEVLEYYHEPPTRAKFLSAAVEETQEDIVQHIRTAYAV